MADTNNKLSASRGDEEAPAGLKVEYNHDLDVSDAFLNAHPNIQEALKDKRLLEAFKYYDDEARSHKRSFHFLGLWSLILGSVPLLLAALRMVAGEAALARVSEIYIGADLCGVASIFFILWAWKKRHRALWCQAVFCRERLRQWHFQKFLDGGFVGLLETDKAQYEAELNRRWGALQQNLKDGYGMMVDFIRNASRRNDFFHNRCEYTDPRLAKRVFDAMWILRFEHQLRFSQRKVEPEGEQGGLALQERTVFSETLASATLVGAIFVSALALLFSSAHVFAAGSPLWGEPSAITRSLAGVALFLAVLSAASRAYRAGYTLPDESESYEEYCDRVRETEVVFLKAPNDHQKLRELENLEEEAAAELRRFLRIKTRATFVS